MERAGVYCTNWWIRKRSGPPVKGVVEFENSNELYLAEELDEWAPWEAQMESGVDCQGLLKQKENWKKHFFENFHFSIKSTHKSVPVHFRATVRIRTILGPKIGHWRRDLQNSQIRIRNCQWQIYITTETNFISMTLIWVMTNDDLIFWKNR